MKRTSWWCWSSSSRILRPDKEQKLKNNLANIRPETSVLSRNSLPNARKKSRLMQRVRITSTTFCFLDETLTTFEKLSKLEHFTPDLIVEHLFPLVMPWKKFRKPPNRPWEIYTEEDNVEKILRSVDPSYLHQFLQSWESRTNALNLFNWQAHEFKMI